MESYCIRSKVTKRDESKYVSEEEEMVDDVDYDNDDEWQRRQFSDSN